jgi:ABC-type dipeptide/oligopeptide/nickel transport system ATPase component
VEHGDTADIFEKPKAEYTRTLLDALPGRDIHFAAADSATKEGLL